MGRQFGEGAAGHSQSWVAKSPLMKVNGMKGTEAVDALKMIGWQLEASGALEEGVVGQLDGWMKRDWCWQSLAAHGCYTQSSRLSGRDRKYY